MATKTKNLIIDSFLSLAAQDDIDVEKISITDIVDNCDISRQTFYYHFKDIDEMLSWAFQNETQNLLKELPKTSKWHEAIRLYEPFLVKYSCFLKKSINTRIFVKVYTYLYDNMYNFTKIFITEQSKYKYNEKTDFAVNIYVYGLIGFIICELKKNNPDFSEFFDRAAENLSM